MASTPSGDSGPDQRVMDNKTLLYGATSLILILCGLVWGLWNSNHDQQIESNQRSNQLQWQKLNELERTIIDNTGRLARLEADGRDREDRIRALERSWRK